MKKLKFFTIITVLCSLFFTSCFNPVFYEIRKDVEPEETKLYGPINQLTRFSVPSADGKSSNIEYLTVLADQGIRYKEVSSTKHDEWIVYDNLPVKMHKYNFANETHEGEMLIGLFASSNTLYLLTAQYKVDDSQGTTYPFNISLWANSKITHIKNSQKESTWQTDSNWELIISDSKNEYFPIYHYSDYYYSAFSIFQTNAVKPENRKVFLRKGDGSAKKSEYRTCSYFELNGTNITPKEISTNNVVGDSSSTIRSVVYFNDDVLFFNGYAAITNETETSPATKFYYNNDGDLYYGTSKTQTYKTFNIPKTKISAIALCSDVVIVGCADWNSSSIYSSDGGIYKATLKEGIPANSTTDFSTNAKFQIPNSYYITNLLNATPDKSELESCLYCGTQVRGNETNKLGSTKNVGLWSYYPTRGNWNRE